MTRKNAWLSYDETQLQALTEVNEAYKHFISVAKTERESVAEAIRLASAQGFRDLEQIIASGEPLKAGDKVYANNMNKTLALFVIGSEPFEKGMNILGAHVDSPRLDVKPNPLYEDGELVLLDTHYYGGIKKYLWVTIPLALHGVIVKKDGTVVTVSIGEDPEDPVFCISDLLIHLSRSLMSKSAAEVVEGENLNVLVGSIPAKDAEKEAAKTQILSILKEKYDVEEEDFLSAELEVVPAGPARDLGLDRSMIIGYGHDDRICAYTSLAALLAVDAPARTSACLLVDKEEIGSVGSTGMKSDFFRNTVAEIMDRLGVYSELSLRRALWNSKVISSDVSAGFDPNYPSASEVKNTSFFGKGIVITKYTGSGGKGGSNDASAEYLASLRKIFDDAGVYWQTGELGKVDQGGGGTIAYITANYCRDVVDAGIAVHSMHAPHEVASKADIYEAVKAYTAFLKATF